MGPDHRIRERRAVDEGDVGNVVGPNLSDSTGTDHEGVPGDGDLNAIAGEGAATEDASML